MSRVRYIFTIVIMIIAVFAFTNCTPLGSISNFEYDSFWVVPKRMTYSPSSGMNFIPQDDLTAFASFLGTVDSIPIGKVEIEVEEKGQWYGPIGPDEPYPFFNYGKMNVRASYSNLSYQYSIEVLNPSSGGNGNGTGDPNFGGDDDFIGGDDAKSSGLIWL